MTSNNTPKEIQVKKMALSKNLITIALSDDQVAAIKASEPQELYKPKRPVITEPEDAYKFVKYMRSLKKEHVVILTLSSRNRIIGKHSISTGIVDASLVHPREVFRAAILDCASKIIVIHNHPSGDIEPSEDDMLITKRLVTAGKIIGIKVIDHMIIGDGWYSLQKEERM